MAEKKKIACSKKIEKTNYEKYKENLKKTGYITDDCQLPGETLAHYIIMARGDAACVVCSSDRAKCDGTEVVMESNIKAYKLIHSSCIAIQYKTKKDLPEILHLCHGQYSFCKIGRYSDELNVQIHVNDFRVNFGDWVVKMNGEFTVYSNDVFEQTFMLEQD